MADFVERMPTEDRCVLEVIGELDLTAADDFVEAGLRALTRAPVVEVDLAGLTFLDSRGLGALVRIRNEARAASKSLVLTNPSEQTQRLLRITGLEKTFGVAPEES